MLRSSTVTGTTAVDGGGIHSYNWIAPIPVWMDTKTTVTYNTPNDCVSC